MTTVPADAAELAPAAGIDPRRHIDRCASARQVLFPPVAGRQYGELVLMELGGGDGGGPNGGHGNGGAVAAFQGGPLAEDRPVPPRPSSY
jgi:hypothetical protein